MSYIGRQPVPQASRYLQEGTISTPTDEIGVVGGYSVNNIHVYINGVLLPTDEYTANDSVKIIFDESLPVGTKYRIEEFRTFEVAEFGTATIQGVQTALEQKVDKVTGKQLTTEDYTTADKAKLDSIEYGANKATTSTLIIEDSEDATKRIQDALLDKGVTGGGILEVRRDIQTEPLVIDGRINIRWDNTHLNITSPIQYGKMGSIRIKGSEYEFTRNPEKDTLALIEDATVDGMGRLKLTVQPGEGSGIYVGDQVVLRGLVGATNTIERQYSTVLSVDGDVITLEDPPGVFSEESAEAYNLLTGGTVSAEDPFLFKAIYTDINGDQILHPESGKEIASRMSLLAKVNIGTDIAGPVRTIELPDTVMFEVGQLVMIQDDQTEDDQSGYVAGFTNYVNSEIAQVAEVTPTTVSFAEPVLGLYKAAFGARLTALKPVTGSSVKLGKVGYYEPQDSYSFHALQMDYAAYCTAQATKIEGRGYRASQGGRISYCYHCSIRDTVVDAGYRYEVGGAGYGLTMYYSSHCTLEGNLVTESRHGYLLQGVKACDIIRNVSKDDMISGIDLHGTNNLNNRILYNKVYCGKNRGADKKAGIRIGNSSHIVADKSTEIRGNWVEGYDEGEDRGIDIAAPTDMTIIADNTIVNCSRGVANYNNNGDRITVTQRIPYVLAENNTFINVSRGLEFITSSLSQVGEVRIGGNIFVGCDNPVYMVGVEVVRATDNSSVKDSGSTSPMFLFKNMDDIRVSRNSAGSIPSGVSLEGCTDAVIYLNDFTDCTLVVDDVSGNTGTQAFKNTISETSAGGGGVTTVSYQRIMATLPDNASGEGHIPHDNSKPLDTEGFLVMNPTVVTSAGSTVKVEGFVPYVAHDGSTNIVTLTLYVNGVLVDVGVSRVTTGLGSGQSLYVNGTFTSTGSDVVMIRVGHTDAGVNVLLNTKYDGLSMPYIQVTSYEQ